MAKTASRNHISMQGFSGKSKLTKTLIQLQSSVVQTTKATLLTQHRDIQPVVSSLNGAFVASGEIDKRKFSDSVILANQEIIKGKTLNLSSNTITNKLSPLFRTQQYGMF